MTKVSSAGARVLERMRGGDTVIRGWVGTSWRGADGKGSLHMAPHPSTMEALEARGLVIFTRTAPFVGEWRLAEVSA